MEEDSKRNTQKIELNWEVLLPHRDDDPPPEILVTPAAEMKHSSVAMDSDQQEHYVRSELSGMTDRELEVAIMKKTGSYKSVGKNLPDKGEKLLKDLKSLQAEKEYRERNPVEKENNGCTERQRSEKPEFLGTSNGLRQDASSSVQHMSTFGQQFCRKLGENPTESRTVNAFDNDISCLRSCGRRSSQSLPREPNKNTVSSRKSAFRCPTKLSGDVNKDLRSNGEQRGRRPSSCHSDRKFSLFSKKRKESQFTPLTNLKTKCRSMPTVNLVDEDEEELKPFDMFDKADELDECSKDITTYYPSRDDQDPIEICSSDIEHLKPEAYLSSTIMNFYIRYLQLSTSKERKICGYHFFSTYFYSKLKKAVSKKNDEENSFVKFRRWWKGVNIFEKAYIFIPINEHLHWSLIIICIPDKEDDSGPVMLHLDSLGLHSSKQIFDNAKSFLIEEWNYLNQAESPADHPFADRIWKNFPRRIDEKIIEVPQQRNDYDCGLFVLFFMERFIADAPQRMKRTDLSMFGNRWFKPDEASSLRRKILSLIKDLLTASKRECTPVHDKESVPSVAPLGGMMSQPIDC